MHDANDAVPQLISIMDVRLKYSKVDRNEVLSQNVKNILLDQSPLRRKEFRIEKVTTRTEDLYMAIDHKENMALKMERTKVCLLI